MTRAWLIDLLTSLIIASVVVVVLTVVGAPTWASIGFGLVYYLLRPMRYQDAVKSRGTYALDFGDKPVPKREAA